MRYKPTYYVDIPRDTTDEDQAYQNVATFKTKKAAIAFAMEHFGADKQGKIQLVTGG